MLIVHYKATETSESVWLCLLLFVLASFFSFFSFKGHVRKQRAAAVAGEGALQLPADQRG